MTTLDTVEEVLTLEAHHTTPVGDPYPDKTPKSFIEREFLLQTIDISTISDTILFPAEKLILIPTISTYSTRFRYLRAGISLKFLLLSNERQYGDISVSFIPWTNSTTDWLSQTQQSQSKQILINIAERDAVYVKLPYLSPKLFWDLTEEKKCEMGWRVVIRPWAIGSTTLASVGTAKLQVFASFIDTETAGYLPEPATEGRILMQSSTLPSRIAKNVDTTQKSFLGMASAGASWLSNKAFGVSPDQALGVLSGNLSEGPKLYAAAHLADISSSKAVQQRADEPKSQPVKLGMCPDLSAPSGSNMISELGDSAPKSFAFLPDLNNHSSVYSIIKQPTFHSTIVLTTTAVQSIVANPIFNGSYANYFDPMYKYFRGSTKLFFYFSTSPDVSAQIKITVYPASVPAANPHTEGDLPTEIIQISGTEKYCVEVPYLSINPWEVTTEYQWPTVTVGLVSNLLQPFDKSVSIFMHVYKACGSDWQFAGLQSIVPNETPGERIAMQCSIEQEFNTDCRTFGKTYDFPYQGGMDQLSTVLGRFSSRDPKPELLFPFPIKIVSAAALVEVDNFDYVANLFAFYSGDTNVRMLFSKGASAGLLQAVVGNSRTSPAGDTWKAGNSMALTDQTVWPMLEFRYPYLNKQEFDSIWHPSGMYPQYVDSTAELSTFFISASEDFRLLYLLPVPFVLPPAAERVAMQSTYSRMNQNFTFCGHAQSVPGDTSIIVDLPEFFDFSQSAQFDLSLSVYQIGTAPFNLFAYLSTTDDDDYPGTLRQGGILALPLQWRDVGSDASYIATVSGSTALGGQTSDSNNLYLVFTWDNAAVVPIICWAVRVCPFGSTTLPLCPDTLGSRTIVEALPGEPLSVLIESVADPNGLPTRETHLPLEVTLGPVPWPVTVENSVDVNVVSGSVSIDGNITVSGSTDPEDSPVWTTLYKPLPTT